MSWYGITFSVGFWVQVVLIIGLGLYFLKFFRHPNFRFRFTARLRLLRKQDGLIKFGLFATFMIFFLVFVLFGFEHCDSNEICQNKLIWLVTSSPNEVGDTLAGVSSALAFLWLILTVKMQSRELKEQRIEFIQQRKATEDMAKSLLAQKEIFQGEQRQREENRAENQLDEKLRSLVLVVSEMAVRGPKWAFSNDIFFEDYLSNGEVKWVSIGDLNDEHLLIEEAITKLRRRLEGIHFNLQECRNWAIDFSFPQRSDAIPILIERILNIVAMESDLSASQRERLERMRFDEIIAHLESLYNTPEYWDDQKP